MSIRPAAFAQCAKPRKWLQHPAIAIPKSLHRAAASGCRPAWSTDSRTALQIRMESRGSRASSVREEQDCFRQPRSDRGTAVRRDSRKYVSCDAKFWTNDSFSSDIFYGNKFTVCFNMLGLQTAFQPPKSLSSSGLGAAKPSTEPSGCREARETSAAPEGVIGPFFARDRCSYQVDFGAYDLQMAPENRWKNRASCDPASPA